MDIEQRWPGDDGDSFASLDFGDESAHDSGAALDFGDESAHDSGAALDFGDESVHDNADPSSLDALDTGEKAEFADTGTGLGAIDTLPEDSADSEETGAAADETADLLATVTNPPETVSVTASMGGMIVRVELSADAARMTESELADEIRVIADLAQQRALSIQHTFVFDMFHQLGADDDEDIADMLENGPIKVPSPEQAAAAQAEVFATRYASDDGGALGR